MGHPRIGPDGIEPPSSRCRDRSPTSCRPPNRLYHIDDVEPPVRTPRRTARATQPCLSHAMSARGGIEPRQRRTDHHTTPWHRPRTHTGRPRTVLAASRASIEWFSTSCAAHSSKPVKSPLMASERMVGSSPHDMVTACATSWRTTLSRRGGRTASDMHMTWPLGSVVASLGEPVLSTRRGSPTGTRTTLQTSPFATNDFISTCLASGASRA